MIAGLLARDDVRGQPFGHARHSGYQRLAAGRTLILLDCGRVPEGAFADQCPCRLSRFRNEFGTAPAGGQLRRGRQDQRGWDTALRATAAHSTLTLADRSSAQILPPGLARDLLGPRLMGGPQQPVTRRSETAQGWMVEASHDAYVPEFGLRHERKITLSPQGTDGDRRRPAGARQDAARAPWLSLSRFHIHPDVRVSRLEGGGILLKLPNGEGWRFRAGGGELDGRGKHLSGQRNRAPDRAAGGDGAGARHPRRSRLGVRADCGYSPSSNSWVVCACARRMCKLLRKSSPERFMVRVYIAQEFQSQEGQGLARRNRRQRQEAETLQGFQSLSLRSGQRRQSRRWIPTPSISTAAARWFWTR